MYNVWLAIAFLVSLCISTGNTDNCERCHLMQTEPHQIRCMGQVNSTDWLIISSDMFVFQLADRLLNPSNMWRFEEEPVNMSSKWPQLYQMLMANATDQPTPWKCFTSVDKSGNSFIVFSNSTQDSSRMIQFNLDTGNVLNYTEDAFNVANSVVLSSTSQEHYVLTSLQDSQSIYLAIMRVQSGKVLLSKTNNEKILCLNLLNQMMTVENQFKDSCHLQFNHNISGGFLHDELLYLLGAENVFAFNRELVISYQPTETFKLFYQSLVVCWDEFIPVEGNPYPALLLASISLAALTIIGFLFIYCLMLESPEPQQRANVPKLVHPNPICW